jgi:hypothetical protein
MPAGRGASSADSAGGLALVDFGRHPSFAARQRTAGAYRDTLQRLLAFDPGSPAGGGSLKVKGIKTSMPCF